MLAMQVAPDELTTANAGMPISGASTVSDPVVNTDLGLATRLQGMTTQLAQRVQALTNRLASIVDVHVSGSKKGKSIPFGRVTGIRMGLLSSETIRSRSVVHINSDVARRTAVAFGSVNDQRLGTIKPSRVCCTCGGSSQTCPGHIGHIELFAPVASAEFIPVIHRVLSCVCYHCSTLLVPADHYKIRRAQSESYRKRINVIASVASRVKVCPDPECAKVQPERWVRQELVLLRPVWNVHKSSDVPVVTPHTIHRILSNVPDEVSALMGFDPVHAHIKNTVFEVLPVPPILVRPSRSTASEDDISSRLRSVIRADILLRRHQKDESLNLSMWWQAPPATEEDAKSKSTSPPPLPVVKSPDEEGGRPAKRVRLIVDTDDATVATPTTPAASTSSSDARPTKRARHAAPSTASHPDDTSETPRPVIVPDVPGVDEPRELPDAMVAKAAANIPDTGPDHTSVPRHLSLYFDLARQTAGLQNSKLNPRLASDYGRDRASIRHRFSASKHTHGRVRGNILGKRGDQTARAVLAPDTTYLDPDEIGVPVSVCMRLTIKERVTKFNFNKMLRLVVNGPNRHPGANYVERGDTTWVLPDFAAGGLKVGDIVHRHHQRDDLCILNRQPSLHRFALMAYRVVPMNHNVFKLHLADTSALNADYDGDEANLFPFAGYRSRAEAKVLMSPTRNVFKDGSNLINFVQHSCLAVYTLTVIDRTLAPGQWQQLLCQGRNDMILHHLLKSLDQDEICAPMSSRRLVQLFIPTYDRTGPVNRKRINRLFMDMCETLVDGEVVCVLGDGSRVPSLKLMGFAYRVLEASLYLFTTSLSFADCAYDVPLPDKDAMAVSDLYEQVSELQDRADRARADNATTGRNLSSALVTVRMLDEVEDKIATCLDAIRDVFGDHAYRVLDGRPTRSGLLDIVESGAKGNPTHITQNAGCVGQQLTNESARPDKATSHVTTRRADGLGFVAQSFSDGLDALGFFHHLTASRVGLTATAVSTAETGYCYRRISKCTEDLRIFFDGSVRDANGNVLVFNYGFDTTRLVLTKIRFVRLSEAEITAAYSYPGRTCADEIAHIMALRAELYSHKFRFSRTFVPFDFSKLPLMLRRDKFIAAHVKDVTSGRCTAEPITYSDIRVAVKRAWDEAVATSNLADTIHTRCAFFDHMSTRTLVDAGVRTKFILEKTVQLVVSTLVRECVVAGTPVGNISAQSFSAPLTQLQLDRFHVSGLRTQIVGGVVRIKELLNLARTLKTPSVTIFTEEGVTLDGLKLVTVHLSDLVIGYVDTLHPAMVGAAQAMTKHQGEVVCTLELDKNVMIDRRITPRMLSALLVQSVGVKASVASRCTVYHTTVLTDEHWWVTLVVPPLADVFGAKNIDKPIVLGNVLYHMIINANTRVQGIPGIRDFFESTSEVNRIVDGTLKKITVPTIRTLGSNLLEICSLPGVNVQDTVSNDVREIFTVLGIDAAATALAENLIDVMLASKASVSRRHIQLIAATMCRDSTPHALTFAGRTHAKTSPLKLALFERSLDSFLSAAVAGHHDDLNGVSEAILAGQQVRVGTNSHFDVIQDETVQPNTVVYEDDEVSIDDLTEEMNDFLTQSHDAELTSILGRLPFVKVHKPMVQKGMAVTAALKRFAISDEKTARAMRNAAENAEVRRQRKSKRDAARRRARSNKSKSKSRASRDKARAGGKATAAIEGSRRGKNTGQSRPKPKAVPKTPKPTKRQQALEAAQREASRLLRESILHMFEQLDPDPKSRLQPIRKVGPDGTVVRLPKPKPAPKPKKKKTKKKKAPKKRKEPKPRPAKKPASKRPKKPTKPKAPPPPKSTAVTSTPTIITTGFGSLSTTTTPGKDQVPDSTPTADVTGGSTEAVAPDATESHDGFGFYTARRYNQSTDLLPGFVFGVSHAIDDAADHDLDTVFVPSSPRAIATGLYPGQSPPAQWMYDDVFTPSSP